MILCEVKELEEEWWIDFTLCDKSDKSDEAAWEAMLRNTNTVSGSPGRTAID